MKAFLTERKTEVRGEKGTEGRLGSTERERVIVLAQIYGAMPGEEDEDEEAECRRDAKNRITGLALTLTFTQRGDTILLNCSLVSSQERLVLLFIC